MNNGNGVKAKNGVRIPDARRLAIIADAVALGEAEAARRHHVAVNSIYHWLKPAGGLAAVREYCMTLDLAAIAQASRSASKEFIRRADKLSEDHLIEVVLELIRSKHAATSTTIINAPSAQAGAVVSDDGIGRAIIAAERAFLAECQSPALGATERKALESGDR